MYSFDQILKGLQKPERAYYELRRQYQSIQTHMPHDIGIQGSYWTMNVGDRAIGEIIQQELAQKEYRAKLYPKRSTSCHAPVSILGGGGVLHDWYGTDHLRKRLEFLSENSAVIGVGVPGIRTPQAREIVEEKLQDVELITVRDERSRKLLDPLYDGEIHTTACPALLHSPPNSQSSQKTGVNFRPWFNLSSEVLSYYFDYEPEIQPTEAKEKYEENIIEICERLDNPVFIPFHKKDEEFARNILDIDILPYEFSVEKTLSRVSSVEKMVCMRFHSFVFSIICDTPVLPIDYDPKVTELAFRAGVDSYKPNEDIPLDFQSIDDSQHLIDSAQANFDLMDGFLKGQDSN